MFVFGIRGLVHLFSKLLICPIFFLITLIQRHLSLSIKLSQILLIFLQSANVMLSSWLKMDSLKCGNLKNWSSIWHFLNLPLSPPLCFENGDEPCLSFLFAPMSFSFECLDQTEEVNKTAYISNRSRNRPILEAKPNVCVLFLIIKLTWPDALSKDELRLRILFQHIFADVFTFYYRNNIGGCPCNWPSQPETKNDYWKCGHTVVTLVCK